MELDKEENGSKELSKDYLHRVARVFRISPHYVDQTYTLLKQNNFVRIDTLDQLRNYMPKSREFAMRLRLVDRLIADHIDAFAPGRFSRAELTHLWAAHPLFDIAKIYGYEEALIDADLNYRKALDIAVRRHHSCQNFEDYCKAAYEAQAYLELLLSEYATRKSFKGMSKHYPLKKVS